MSATADFIAASPGMIFEHSGFDLPPGFLWCDGSAVSRTSFAKLFGQLSRTTTGNITSGSNSIASVVDNLVGVIAVGMPVSGPGIPFGATVTVVNTNSINISSNATLSTAGASIVIAPHGIGDGTTTFQVPDLRGRSSIGRDDMGGIAANRLTTAGGGFNGLRLGASGGAQSVTLTTAQIPSHRHNASISDPGHSHSSNAAVNGGGSSTGGGGFPMNGAGAATINAAVTGVTLSDGAGNANQTTATGGDGSHPNIPPSMALNKIIKI